MGLTPEEISKIRAEVGRKGGKAKVKKGFAVSGLASQAGVKGMASRYGKKKVEE